MMYLRTSSILDLDLDFHRSSFWFHQSSCVQSPYVVFLLLVHLSSPSCSYPDNYYVIDRKSKSLENNEWAVKLSDRAFGLTSKNKGLPIPLAGMTVPPGGRPPHGCKV